MSIPAFKDYTKLTGELAVALVEEDSGAKAVLGGEAKEWTAEEVGDGNLNLVYIVRNKSGTKGIVVKGALPYVRLIGESWPLALNRIYFEYSALLEESRWAPEFVPRVHRFVEGNAAIVMEFLSPHIILRKGLVQGIVYPRLAADVASFLARTLFNTSDLHLDVEQRRSNVALFSQNHALCGITEQVIFTEPYIEAANNRWTKPHLDKLAASVRDSKALKLCILGLKKKFQTHTQALLHGDLHTGSLMVTKESTKVIDSEFAFYGPMGFDVGAIIANMLLSYFSQDAHAQDAHRAKELDVASYKKWILEQVVSIWTGFEAEFRKLWTAEQESGTCKGAAFPPGFLSGADLKEYQDAYIRGVFEDTVGFAAAKIIRRIFGVAHVEDLESIADLDARAICEKRAVQCAYAMMTKASSFSSINAIVDLASSIPATPADSFQ